MLIPVAEHPIYRAHLLLASAVGGIEFLPPNLQRMDVIAEFFSLSARRPSEAPGVPPDVSRQNASQPQTVLRISTAAKRDFDPFITFDLGELLARLRHVLSLVLGHPDCNDEDRKKVADLWQCVCHEVKEAVLYIQQNKELLFAAWEAGRPYLGPDTMAGRARMRQAQAREIRDEASSSSSSSASTASTATAPGGQNPTPPRSLPPEHKEECVKATRTALGALSLSEQNRRSNWTPNPERVYQDRHEDEGDVSFEDNDEDDDEDLDIQNDMGACFLPDRDGRGRAPTSESRDQTQHKGEGYMRMSDLGYVSPEEDDEEGDNDDDVANHCHEQGQSQLQHRFPSEYQEEERRLNNGLSQVRDQLLHDFRRRVSYHQQQQQQQHLDPSDHQETPKMRWGHNDASSEDSPMESVEALAHSFSRRAPIYPGVGPNITDADSHGSNGDPTI